MRPTLKRAPGGVGNIVITPWTECLAQRPVKFWKPPAADVDNTKWIGAGLIDLPLVRPCEILVRASSNKKGCERIRTSAGTIHVRMHLVDYASCGRCLDDPHLLAITRADRNKATAVKVTLPWYQEQGDVCEVGGSVVTSTSRTEEFTTAARRDRTGIQTKQRVVNTHMRRQRGAKMCLSLRIGSVRARKPLVCGHLSTTLSGVLAGHQWAQI